MIDYERKALKYKKKYEQLLEKLKTEGYDISDSQTGGFDRDQYLLYENDLKQIYNLISGEFDEDDGEFIALTGSGALAYILYKLGMERELEEMNEPNDLDIVYYTKNKLNQFMKQNIGDYVVEPGKQSLDSRTFVARPEVRSEKKIKEFDLTKMKEKKPDFIQINDRVYGKSIIINILNFKKLKELYQDNDADEEKSRSRIELIDKIIANIRSRSDPDLIHQYRLDTNVSTRSRAPTRRDADEDEFVIKTGLFGFDSDNEEDNIFLRKNEFGKRTNVESSQPAFRFEESGKTPKKRLFDSDEETLAGISELRPGLRNRTFSEESIVGTLDGITELDNTPPRFNPMKTPVVNKKINFANTPSPLSKNLFGAEFEEIDVAETLDGISELEIRKKESGKNKNSKIKQPPIRPTV